MRFTVDVYVFMLTKKWTKVSIGFTLSIAEYKWIMNHKLRKEKEEIFNETTMKIWMKKQEIKRNLMNCDFRAQQNIYLIYAQNKRAIKNLRHHFMGTTIRRTYFQLSIVKQNEVLVASRSWRKPLFWFYLLLLLKLLRSSRWRRRRHAATPHVICGCYMFL